MDFSRENEGDLGGQKRQGQTSIIINLARKPRQLNFPLRKAGGARMAFIMIKHIVMFKLKEKAEGRDKAANIQLLKAMLEALPARIKEIKFFEVGVNFLQASIAYDLVLLSEFESLEALQSYQKHPEHLMVFDFVVKTSESRIVVDYVL